MSDNKEETNQAPTPEELDTATHVTLDPSISDELNEVIFPVWTDERREELRTIADTLSLQVKVIGTTDDPDHGCYVQASDTAISKSLGRTLLKVPESTRNNPISHSLVSRPSFTFFDLGGEKGLLEIRKELHDEYVDPKNGRVKRKKLREIIARRDALYDTLVLNCEVIRDVLTNLRSILAVPIVVSENPDQDWNADDILRVWYPIAHCSEDSLGCLFRVSAWIASCTASCLNSFEYFLLGIEHLLSEDRSFQKCPQNRGRTQECFHGSPFGNRDR